MNTKREPLFKVGDKVIISDESGKKGEGIIIQFRYYFGEPEYYEYCISNTNHYAENWFPENEICLKK